METVKIKFEAEDLEPILSEVRQLQQAVNQLSNKKQKLEFDTSGVRNMRQQIDELQGRIVKMGSRFLTLGKTLQNITSPFTRIVSGALLGVGYTALNKVMSGLSGAFERYDVMNTYSKQLQAMGFEAKDASKAIEELRDSVIGLPTGLDEIVAAQKSYVGATNDVERATQLAIAANNAYIAGGTTARQKKFIQNQLLALSSGAELSTSQWQSLQRNAPMALRAVSKELGYADDAYDKFLDDLKKGEIEGKKFLDAFIEVGTNGTIRNAANVMKMTWNALSENISNATKRLGQNVLESLDSVFRDYNGRNLIQNLLGFSAEGEDLGNGIKDWINSLGESIGTWIKSNPERIITFFENLKKIDFKGILKGTFDEIAWIAEKLVWVFNRIDGSQFAKYMIRGNILGKILSLFGGFIKGLASPLALLGVGGGTLLGKLGGLFTGVKGLGKTLDATAELGKKVANIGLTWQGVASKAIAVAAIPAIAGSMLIMAKAFKEIQALNIDPDRVKTFVLGSIQCLTVFGAYAEGLGFLLSSTPIGWGAAISEGVGIATILALTGTMVALAESLQKIQNVTLPNRAKIDAVVDSFKAIIPAIQDVVNTLSGNKGIIAGWTKKSEAKSAKSIVESFSGIIDTFVGMTDGLKKLAKVKDIEGKLQSATDIINKLGEGLEPLRTAINKAFGSYEQDFVEQGTQTVRKTFDSSAASEYGDMTKALTGVITNIVSMLTAIQSLQTKINEATRGGEGYIAFKSLKERLNTIIENISSLVMDKNGLYTLSESAKWVKDISNISDMLYNIGVIIDRLQEVSRKSAYAKTGSITMTNVTEAVNGISKLGQLIANTGTFPNGTDLNEKITNLSNAIEQIGLLANKIRVAAQLIGGGVEGEMGKIRDFLNTAQFNGMQNLVGKIGFEFKVDFGDTTTQVYNSVWNEFERLSNLIDTMNLKKDRVVTVNFIPNVKYQEVIRMINAAHYAINYALRWTLNPINRTVKININGDVDNNVGSVGASTGGYITPHGVIYRRFGGFTPRGTDTVPAMLTPGEYVMSRGAVDAFGARFMQRINNLDIPGAIRELSIRTGRKLSPASQIINNTTDNRSYSNVQHINTNNPNFAFRRSRWVSELR